MKSRFYTKTLIALAVAIAAAAATVSLAQEKPIPPPATENALPPGIPPNSPTAQVVKLIQAGVELGVIKNFVSNSTTAFGLDADQIIALNDVGVPAEIINAMLNRDKILYAAAKSVVNNPAPVVVETAAPAAPVTVDYFNDTLTPYGSWVEVEGYGRCWRPTTVVYDSGWRPYCDRGHWVYTDCGWYWDSDYSWGVTFHYGRWFHHSHLGWCWYPDTEWAPSWVTWRSGGDYCGWAPLPPLAVYRPGIGFCYRGANVSVAFDFELEASCFTFVSSEHFCDHHPRRYCPEPERVTQIFNHTTVINNYNIHNTTIVNNGIAITQVGSGNHHLIQPVQVSTLPNAGRHGWRGNDGDRPGRHDSVDNRNERPAHPLPVLRPNGNGDSGQHAVAGNQPAQRDNAGRVDNGNFSRGERQPRPLPVLRSGENNDAGRRQNVEAAPQNSGGSVFISHQPTAGVSENRRNDRERPLPENRWNAQPAPVVSAVTPTSPTAPTPVQNHRQFDRGETEDGFRNARSSHEQPQPHFTAPVMAERSTPPVEQRQFTTPAPIAMPEHSQTHERPVAAPVEMHQSHVETVQHSSPPASQPHESERSSSRNSERNSDKDKKDR